jgi:hypothetical protein
LPNAAASRNTADPKAINALIVGIPLVT